MWAVVLLAGRRNKVREIARPLLQVLTALMDECTSDFALLGR